MPAIDNSSILISSMPLSDQVSAPSSPPSGKTKIFTKSDGLYTVNSSGTVIGPFAASGGATDWFSADAMTYSSADGPSFVMTCSGDQTTKYCAGMFFRLTQTTVKYFIITKVSYSGVTSITLYGGTDYTLANAAITSPYYSFSQSPFGFPLSPAKWTVEYSGTTDVFQSSPVSGTWYNLGSVSISIPIGIWRVYYMATAYAVVSSNTSSQSITLSNANNSESDVNFTSSVFAYTTACSSLYREGIIAATSKTTYYLNSKSSFSPTDINFRGDFSPTIIRAVCAYL